MDRLIGVWADRSDVPGVSPVNPPVLASPVPGRSVPHNTEQRHERAWHRGMGGAPDGLGAQLPNGRCWRGPSPRRPLPRPALPPLPEHCLPHLVRWQGQLVERRSWAPPTQRALRPAYPVAFQAQAAFARPRAQPQHPGRIAPALVSSGRGACARRCSFPPALRHQAR